MRSFLLHWQCTACLACLNWMLSGKGNKCYFVECCFQDSFTTARNVACIYILDTYRRNDNRRMTNDRRTKKGRRKTSFQKYSPLTLLQGFERLACERVLETEHKLHILTPLLWPSRCVLFSWCWGPLHRGFLVSNSLGVCWQLLLHPKLNWVK